MFKVEINETGEVKFFNSLEAYLEGMANDDRVFTVTTPEGQVYEMVPFKIAE